MVHVDDIITLMDLNKLMNKESNVADVSTMSWVLTKTRFLLCVCALIQDEVHPQRECDVLPEQHCVLPAAFRSHL